MSLEDELLRIEGDFWAASGDGSQYESGMSDSGWCLLPVGRMDKASTIEATAKAEPWASYRFEDVEVIEANDVAILHYRVTARRSDGHAYEALVATTYRRHRGGWQLLLHQQTPLVRPADSH